MGNAFLYGNGGGTELAIKIIGRTQRPETGKQGTIWINTDQKITGWTIQGEEPISPTEGMVWINNITYASLNALKKNGIWFTPISAKQYTSGAWVKKIGEYYNNNQWIAFFEATIHVTYPAGSTCTANDGVTTLTAPDTSGTWDCVVPNAGTWTVRITDGTKSKEKVVVISEDGQIESVELSYIIYIVKDGVLTKIGLSNSLTSRLATVTQNEGNVYVNNSYTEYVASVVTGEKIDLTSFTKVVASVNIVTKGTSQTQSKFNGIGLTLTQGVAYSSLADAAAGIEHEAMASKTGTMTLTIDAESITGEWYVGFAIGTKGKFYIYDLYVE